MQKQGFTFIEVLVVMGIMTTLLALSIVRATSIERRAPLSATVTTVLADMRGAQTKAMSGYTQGETTAQAFGINFQTNQYVLFKGTSFNGADPTNAAFPLPTNITFSVIDLPGASIIFDKGSGDVVGFSDAANSVTLTQTLTNESKVITINRYGAVISVE